MTTSSRSLSSWRPLAGAFVGAVVVGGVALASLMTWPTYEAEPAAVTIAPSADTQMLVCAGGLLATARDATDADGLSLAAPQAVVSVSESELGRDELMTEYDGPGPLVLSAQTRGFAAAGSATVSDPDLVGFSASACRPALLDSWVVAGSGATGAADLLVLSNPGEVVADVTVTVYGAGGAEVPPGGDNIIVPAGAQRVISVPGIALGEEAPVFHIQASGAPVMASLQSRVTRTLEPGGVDQATSVPQLSTAATIPGVTVTAADAGEATGEAATSVRVLSPSQDAQVTVTVRAVGSAEPVAESLVVDALAGIPTTIDVPALAVGAYVVDVAATVPVAAALWQATGFGEGSDFAWYAPAPLVTERATIAVPVGPSPTLTLVNPDASETTVQLSQGGQGNEVTIPAGTSVQIPLQAAATYELVGLVRASVGFQSDAALAAFTVWPDDAAAQPIVVYP